MKQHIDMNQMFELKTKDLSQLLKINESLVTAAINNKLDGYYRNEIVNYSYKLDIGYLIAFLIESKRLLFISYYDLEETMPTVVISHPSLNFGIDEELMSMEEAGLSFRNNELCDALWGAVKEVLIGRAVLD